MPFSTVIYLVFIVVLVVGGLAVSFQVLRYELRTLFSENWPRATATIARDFVGVLGRGAIGGFFTYTFVLNGKQFSGRFVIADDQAHAELLQEKLDGQPIEIKYKPSNPRVSLILEICDPRLEGRIATQNPYWFIWPTEVDTPIYLKLN
jgi:hypothetical protein